MIVIHYHGISRGSGGGLDFHRVAYGRNTEMFLWSEKSYILIRRSGCCFGDGAARAVLRLSRMDHQKGDYQTFVVEQLAIDVPLIRKSFRK